MRTKKSLTFTKGEVQGLKERLVTGEKKAQRLEEEGRSLEIVQEYFVWLIDAGIFRPSAQSRARTLRFKSILVLMSSSELATERTPLINGSNISSDRHEVPSSLSELEEDLYSEEFKRNDKSYPTAEIIRDCVSFPYPSQETKDALVILLCLRRISFVRADLPEVLEERNEPIPEYERHAFEGLSRLLKPGMEEELDSVLWSSFYIRKGEDKRQSGVCLSFSNCLTYS